MSADRTILSALIDGPKLYGELRPLAPEGFVARLRRLQHTGLIEATTDDDWRLTDKGRKEIEGVPTS